MRFYPLGCTERTTEVGPDGKLKFRKGIPPIGVSLNEEKEKSFEPDVGAQQITHCLIGPTRCSCGATIPEEDDRCPQDPTGHVLK